MDEKISKRIKEISVEILVDFDEFCKEYNLEYRISFGTLLGAVRHKGFIPWDDDIDVDMPIEDYVRFRKCWLKYGDKEKYFLQTKKTDPKIPCPFYRLRMNNTTWSEPGYESFPMHWGIPLDIFPIYHLPKKRKLRKLQRKLFSYLLRMCEYDWQNPNANRLVCWFYEQLTLIFEKGVSLISNCAKSTPDIYYPYGYPERREGKKEWLYPAKSIVFEGVELQSYPDPHTYLAWQYGENYMTPPPENQRQGHVEGIIDLEHDGEYYTHCLRRNK